MRHGTIKLTGILESLDGTTQIEVANDKINIDIESVETIVLGDGTNEELVKFTNAGTKYGLYLKQDGVLASGQRALYVYSNAAQTSTYLVEFNLNNASSTQVALSVVNQGSGNCITTSQGSLSAPAYSFEADKDTGIYLPDVNNMHIVAGGASIMSFSSSAAQMQKHLRVAGTGSYDLGSNTEYWGEIFYKTLTDKGCLGWFDEGVELMDGSVVSDLEALCSIQKHPTKLTVYGKPMLDYRTFPKVAYKKAVNDDTGEALLRDANDEPYYINKKGETVYPSDGVEMTSMFSIFIGAFKELKAENEALKARIETLEQS